MMMTTHVLTEKHLCAMVVIHPARLEKSMTRYLTTTMPDGLYWAQEGTWYPTKVEVIKGMVYCINGRPLPNKTLDMYGPLETSEEHRTPPNDMVEKALKILPLWCVLRQDDNGNKFQVGKNLYESEADNLVSKMTSRGHKQMYWKEFSC